MSYSHTMELRHLRYFVAVAVHGSFNRAAQILHLTQPALSRQVKNLEGELGVSLLVRGQNTVKLTKAGDLFYEEARDVLARADEAVEHVRGEARSETLSVGYAPSMVAGILPAALEKFQSITPHVRIELADLSSREINDLVHGGRLDLVISLGISVAKGIPGFQWTELRCLQPVLVMPETHPLAKLKRIPLGRLRNLPLIGLAKDNYPEYAPHVRGMLKPFGISPHFVSFVNDSLSTLFTELEAHRGAAILTEGIAGVMPRTLGIRPFAPRLPGALVMIGYPASHPNPHAEKFTRLLLEEVRWRESEAKRKISMRCRRNIAPISQAGNAQSGPATSGRNCSVAKATRTSKPSA